MSSSADSFLLPEENYLNRRTTLWSWIAPRDHKRVALLFLGGVLFSLLLGGTFAMVLRTELVDPDPQFMDAFNYNRMFTFHGVVMIFMFMIPAIQTTFGNFLLPLMLGAKDMALPRAGLAAFYLYVLGSALILTSMYWGGPVTGWTFFVPYSSVSPAELLPTLGGICLLGMSNVLTSINQIVTVHTLRAPGLKWMRMPVFVWDMYATSIIQVLATPIVMMAFILVGLERWAGIGIFDPSRGGDPILYQHLFWFYAHPVVYIMVLPAMGVISEAVTTFAHRNPQSYKTEVVSTVGIAFVTFFVWGHHMFVTGMSPFAGGFFGITSMFVAIFTVVKVFDWTLTLRHGQVAWNAPLLYVLGFIFLIIFGGMSGVAFATTSLNVHWHDTYFVVAHFHYIMAGAVLLAFVGALHYWFPKMFGRMYPEKGAAVAAGTIIFGFMATFFPQFLLGNMGMPRRYFQYPAEFQTMHVFSTAGAYILGIGLLMVAVYLGWALFYGPVADANPFASAGFEWRSPTPPPRYNFVQPPDFSRDHTEYSEPVVSHAP